MKHRFSDKVVLITGSSSGIGRSATLPFAAQGAKVLLASRSRDANQELLDEIDKNGGSAIFVKTDITKTEDIAHMVKRTIEAYGKLDIAVNNAGVEGAPNVKTADYDEQVWNQVIDINLKGGIYEI
ncbi:MAG: NAD(P)-dependent dehydrogenase (short-subunit alcohol dehydrogenase family) [Maribacter sp.]|jgi:NAD(P)-dependent dehydrogenase (short-subunit alcohol dehydrogenase family)